MSDALIEFDGAVLEEAWEYLKRDNLSLALKVEKAVKGGATPEQLSHRFISVAGEHRATYGKRIENAARFLSQQVRA